MKESVICNARPVSRPKIILDVVSLFKTATNAAFLLM